MSVPSQSIDPIYTVVTPIQYPDKSGHATGFFFSIGEQTYLITNYHVVANEDGAPISDTIRILTRPSRQDITKVNHRDIKLHSGGEPSWLEHPKGRDIDVVAIPLDLDVDFDNIGTHYLSYTQLKPDDIILKPGQEAMVIGYPIRGNSPYLPVSRNAVIASPYGAPFQGLPCFAIDADMHSGTSGSPVLTRPSPIQHTEDGPVVGGRQQMHFIGIHSATMQSNHNPSEGPLNLNTEWYAELIKEITKSE
ncbi:S1 family peptidase [Halapricum desulfuricans]|uniref:S1 family peptidase n=1 Tax=Halapricum desulfuricans TaxID=2841257 RepID=UPI001E2E9645|nr:serine protease [Halapricum desulfuricans]